MDARDELAKRGGTGAGLLACEPDELPGGARVALQLLGGELKVERDADELLLGSVVKVAGDPASLKVGGLDHPSAGLAQVALGTQALGDVAVVGGVAR